MAEPSFYEHWPRRVDCVETHISWVFMADDLVYKLKKPVRFSFVDYSSADTRREMCEAEVELNRRLAPQSYLGVRPIVAGSAGLELGPRGGGGGIDYVVEMRRLDESRFGDALLERGELTREIVRAIGARLCEFHADCERQPSDPASPAAVKRAVTDNFETLLWAGKGLDGVRVQAADRLASAFVSRYADLFTRRCDEGMVRDGHGDLRLEHLVIGPEGIEIFDCVEFNPSLRQIDVACDLAFLVMDLALRGADGLAGELVDAYRAGGGDAASDSLLAFYAAYRAFVRAKIEYLRAAQLPEGQKAAECRSRGERYVELGERLGWRMRQPLVVVICGVSASGKTELATELERRFAVASVASDVTRKRLAGLDPTDRGTSEHYTEESNRQTYLELGRTASELAGTEGCVVVDATFRRVADRHAFWNGFGSQAIPVVFFQCHAPAGVLAQRARGRMQQQRVSDATPEIVRAQLAEFEALDELAAEDHLIIRTDRPLGQTVDALCAALDQRLAA